MKNELTHHGILGMKWGKRNGPPYPIEDYSKYSAEEREQMKEKATREGNIKEANANRTYYSDQELRAVKNRYDLNKEVSKLSAEDIKSGQKRFEELSSTLNTASNISTSVANLSSKSIEIYNNLGSVYSYLNGTEFKPIKVPKGDNNNKNKKGGK